jgi:F0F1-type ATP synthase alpha subunit
MNENGNPAKSTMDPQQSIEICGMVTSLIDRCAYIMSGIYADEKLEMLRLHTKHNEMIVTMDNGLVFIVVQCASE